jgi:WD40 repeat protein
MDERMRQRLSDLAVDAPTVAEVPRSLVPRARRRVVRNAAISAVVAAVGIAAMASGIRTFTRADLVPATNAEQLRIDGVRGWIAYGAGGSVGVIDPADPTRQGFVAGEGATPVSWSADGSLLLISREGQDDAAGSLSILHSDGTEASVASAPPGGGWLSLWGGGFSPDGTRIAYSDGLRVFVQAVDGGDRRVLAKAPDGARFGAVTWSPDGLITLARRYVDPAILTLTEKGGPPEVLASLPSSMGFVSSLRWSPDGRTLAVAAEPTHGTRSRVYLYAPGSSEQIELASHSSSVSSPTWSPDGSHIAVVANIDGTWRLLTMTTHGRDTREYIIKPLPYLGVPLAWNPVAP